jgi:hypothetical protein
MHLPKQPALRVEESDRRAGITRHYRDRWNGYSLPQYRTDRQQRHRGSSAAHADFDAMPEASSVFPVWDGEPVPADMVADPEDADGFLVPMRLGFVCRRER